jgi:hypothetical protein
MSNSTVASIEALKNLVFSNSTTKPPISGNVTGIIELLNGTEFPDLFTDDSQENFPNNLTGINNILILKT